MTRNGARTHRNPVDRCLVGILVILVEHKSPALGSGSDRGYKTGVVLEVVDVLGEDVDVWDHLVDEALGALRYLACRE